MMSAAIDSAMKYEDLLGMENHDLPYLFESIFLTEGWGAKSLSKKKFKLLKKIHNQIEAMLREKEKVAFITSGVETSFGDFFIGWLMYYINRKAFIFTTERILILQISPRNEPLVLRAQIEYSAIDRIGSTILGNCIIKFKSGKKVVFIKIPQKDRKLMWEVTEHLKTKIEAVEPNAAGIENLCPHCLVKIEGFPGKCPSCEKAFKSPRKVAWLSFMFPGLGDLYLGQHRWLAVLEIFGALIVWFNFFIPEVGAQPMTLADYIIGAILIILMMHGIDSLATRRIARKGIYPAK